MSFENGRRAELADIHALHLELASQPLTHHLAVLVRDPIDPSRYLHRKLFVNPNIDNESSGDITVSMYATEQELVVPEYDLENAIRGLCFAESDLKVHPDPAVQQMHGAVGVARYEGENNLPLGEILYLIGVKYFVLKSLQRSN